MGAELSDRLQVHLRQPSMDSVKGHGSKYGRKKEAAIAALLTQKNLGEAARAVGIDLKTLKRWMRLRNSSPSGGAPAGNLWNTPALAPSRIAVPPPRFS